MNITYEKITLEVNSVEARNIFHSLIYNVQHAIETHWVDHKFAYEQHEHSRLWLLRELAPFVNRDPIEVIDTLREHLDSLVAAKETKGDA